MEPFLNIVAKDLAEKTGADMSRIAVIFPNRRAGLFFNEHLAGYFKEPVWAPTYMTIDQLFESFLPVKIGDTIKLVCDLHQIFCRETGSEETLDDFYFWGELLLSDFDDIDKNLVDAQRLFTNLSDLRQIMEGNDYLTPAQEEALQKFFQNFSVESRTAVKEKFLSLWDKLGPIYSEYRKTLRQQGIAYEGMLYREVVNNLQPGQLEYDTYVFVGFNVLNKVESHLFTWLKENSRALFYWDYDKFYTDRQNHEAGHFLRQNLINFPSELGEEHFNVLHRPKEVFYIAAPTENAQARYLNQWIANHMDGKEKENVVVLCNEAILSPVLHSIPESVENINITMGYPLAQTPVYSFINALTDLNITGYNPATGRYYYKQVKNVLNHPYTQQLSPEAPQLLRYITEKNRFYPLPSELKKDRFLDHIFTPRTTVRELCPYLNEIIQNIAVIYRGENEEETQEAFIQLYRESLFKAYTILGRFHTLLQAGELTLQPVTFKRLLNRLLAGISIPFNGEPVMGLQIMGLLETRNLDFKNVIMLSVNEGKLPDTRNDSSFIPYTLRRAFGMTTIDYKNSLHAYYFYRLMQRAEHVTLMYNTSSDGLNRGEWSRFMLQFLVEWPHDIKKKYLEATQALHGSEQIEIQKTPVILERLHALYNNRVRLSPSALNIYMDCKMKFYFRYVAGITPPIDISADIDSATFGSIFHRSAELIYQDLTAGGKLIRKEDLEKLLKNDIALENYVDKAFKELFFQIPAEERPEYNGTQLINSAVITLYLKQLLRIDLQYAPFEMVGMEHPVKDNLDIDTPQGKVRIRIGGTIDRIDRKEDTLRIVDYKTGGTPKSPTCVEQLFTPHEDRPGYIFQTFLYAYMMSRQQNLKVAPSLLYIHKAAAEDYTPIIEMGEPRQPKVPVNNFSFYEDEFHQRLTALLQEIFDPQVCFTQTDHLPRCSYCDYKSMCKR